MKLAKFKKEFSGAPFTMREFAETIIGQLDAPKSGEKTGDNFVAHQLRDAAAAWLNADDNLATMLETHKIDIG